MKKVFTMLSIIAMVCAFAIPAFAETYTLTVASSNPGSGVGVTVSPTDVNGRGNGTTQFTRTYNGGAAVTLTASSTASGNIFKKWQKNGVDAGTSRTVSVTMSASTTMTAVYVTPKLTVASSNPSSGVSITVSPNDTTGKGSGTTQFTRSYSTSTSITLTAPATASGNTFQKWQRDGSDYSTNKTITFSLSRNRTMKAVYTTSSTAYTLTVASSNPASGVAVTVSPADKNGQGNGTTQFTRSYTSGAAVTLTAPATSGANTFQKWQKNGVDAGTTQTVSVTMSANTTMTAVYATPTTTSYTLTVASFNPASGVGVTVSPNDTTGQGNGTTQFTRSYYSGAIVTLTAPATAGGNNFQKWQKDGADAGTSTATIATMTANTTMTAVYAAPGSPHASLTWTGYPMCLTCHTDKANEVQASAHYKWEGPATYMVNGAATQGKLNTAVNSYCGNIIGNWGGCSSCHVGVGKRPDDTTLTQQQHLENIDCLICHQKDYKRKKDTLTGLMVPDTANMAITMDQAVQTVHLPVRANCTQCHAKGGGGDNFKRGDLAVAHGTTADRNFDVHMASTATGNLVCQQCHTVQQHKIAGRGSDLRQTDLDVKVSCSTTTCHPTKTASNGHTTTTVYKHVARVACQTCHINKSARNASDTTATEATEMKRDWSVPEWSTATNRYEPTVTLMNDIKPEYKFWNGTSWGYSLKDPAALDTATGKYPTSRPIGTVAGTDSSKLYPFKYKTAHRPYATNLGILIPVETKTYFATGDPNAAIMSSLGLMGYGNTEPYSWVDDDTYQLLTHEVPPATGNVLACTNCHVSGTATQMNLQNLGYALKKPTSDLCNDCHSLKSYTSSYSSFTSIHSRHVDSQQRKCSNCHNFDRPERTNLR
jgi:uncharacterized protein YeaC (DUF1315 family)